jgi:hypothetical protein
MTWSHYAPRRCEPSGGRPRVARYSTTRMARRARSPDLFCFLFSDRRSSGFRPQTTGHPMNARDTWFRRAPLQRAGCHGLNPTRVNYARSMLAALTAGASAQRLQLAPRAPFSRPLPTPRRILPTNTHEKRRLLYWILATDLPVARRFVSSRRRGASRGVRQTVRASSAPSKQPPPAFDGPVSPCPCVCNDRQPHGTELDCQTPHVSGSHPHVLEA